MNKFLWILFYVCCLFSSFACDVDISSGSESEDISSPPTIDSINESVQAFQKLVNAKCSSEEDIFFFIFNVGQGNFILLRKGDVAILVDAGSSTPGVCVSYIEDLFKACLGRAKIGSVIITHPDEDHYNYLKETWFNSEILPGGPVFVGCPIEKRVTIEAVFSSKNMFYRSPGADVDQQWVAPGASFIDYGYGEGMLSDLFGKTCLFRFLKPVRPLLDPRNTNSYSLVFSLEFHKRKILFTGDATGDLLDACLYSSNKKEKAIVVDNRTIMKTINFLIMPHHGSTTEDSWRWTLYTLKHSKKTFVGAIISVDPITSPFGHVQNWIKELSFPVLARAKVPIKIGYTTQIRPGKGKRCYVKKQKSAFNRMYITGETNRGGYCFKTSTDGQIFILGDNDWEMIYHKPRKPVIRFRD